MYMLCTSGFCTCTSEFTDNHAAEIASVHVSVIHYCANPNYYANCKAIILLLLTVILSVGTFICVLETTIILIHCKTISVLQYRIKLFIFSQNLSRLQKNT